MQFVFISLALLGLVSACPMHGQPDHNRAEQNIPVANLRKRNYIRPAPRKIAITNVHVFDGFKYGENTSTVVIDGSFIGTDSMNATVIDGQGGTLMPGLIDNHNHPLDIADLRNLTNWGITTTICTSCWAASDLCQSLRNQPGLTDFYSAGYSAVVPNSSHSKLAESLPSINAPQYFIRNTSMASKWVSDRISTGSDYIKLVAEAYPPTMSQDEHDIIVKTAQEKGYWTMTHASTLNAYLTAIASKTNIIQHTPADALLSSAAIASIIANHQLVTPTVNLYTHPEVAQTSLNLTDSEVTQLNHTIYTNVRNMHNAGVPILAGTDSSINSNGPTNIPFGSTLHKELEILNQIGLSNLDVLKAATSRAAKAYNMLDRGSIRPGLRADLLLVKGNPLVNITTTNEIERVWVGGVEFTDLA